MTRRFAAAVLAFTAAAAATGGAAGAADERAANEQSLCLIVESAAREHGLPLEFFARVIWQESRFDVDAIGPLTRRGERAQGIAQFMPGTAAERGLLDPFDPVKALPEAARFLRELRASLGNLGLAAAAYNAGPRRVREWLAGTGSLPAETQAYVLAITGHPAEDWKEAKDAEFGTPPASCAGMMALLKRSPNVFVAALERRVREAALKPWGVQLAAGFSRDRALASYGRTMRRFASELEDRDPGIIARVLRSRGTRTFYQVHVGADTRGEADALCNRIRRIGGACLVLRNKGT